MTKYENRIRRHIWISQNSFFIQHDNYTAQKVCTSNRIDNSLLEKSSQKVGVNYDATWWMLWNYFQLFFRMGLNGEKFPMGRNLEIKNHRIYMHNLYLYIFVRPCTWLPSYICPFWIPVDVNSLHRVRSHNSWNSPLVTNVARTWRGESVK